MAHSVGALLLPAPATDSGGALTDPALDIIGEYFRAILTNWLGAAWATRAPGEPIVRTVHVWDSEEADFSTNELPALFVWREGNKKPKRLTDAHAEAETTVHVFWALPPATHNKVAKRHAFFNAFDKAVTLAVLHERDPAYTRPQDTDDASIAYGSDVLALAGVDSWALQNVVRDSVSIPIRGAGAQAFPGYLVSLTICETTTSDPTAFGTAPTVIRGDITDGKEPTLVRSSFRVPKTGS